MDVKIAWKLAESNNQLEGMGDLNEHIELLRQASQHSKAAEDYDEKAQSIEEHIVHLMTVASQVLVFDQDNSNPYIETQLQHVKELREKAEKEVSQYTLQFISR